MQEDFVLYFTYSISDKNDFEHDRMTYLLELLQQFLNILWSV